MMRCESILISRKEAMPDKSQTNPVVDLAPPPADCLVVRAVRGRLLAAGGEPVLPTGKDHGGTQ